MIGQNRAIYKYRAILKIKIERLIKMKNENKVTLGASVRTETRDRYKKLLKESGYKADMFINIMMDLYMMDLFEKDKEKESENND